MTARICAISRSSTARTRWHACCAILRLASCLTNTLPRMAPPSLRTPVSLAPRASCRRRSMAPIDPAHAASGLRSAIPPASPCSGSGARFGIDQPQAVRADDDPRPTALRNSTSAPLDVCEGWKRSGFNYWTRWAPARTKGRASSGIR
jgi:hypothetical protein